MDAVEGRPLSVGAPRLAGRGRVTWGVPRPLRRAGARRRALPERGTWPGARGLTGREGLAWPHPPLGRHGRLRRPARLARRWSPAGAWPGARVRCGLVSGPRWSGPRAGPEGLAGTAGRLGPHIPLGGSPLGGSPLGGSPLGGVEPGRSGRACGTRRARVARNVDQATRRIHARRFQHSAALLARPPGRRRPAPVPGGPTTARPSGPGERENQQGHQANREARHAHGHAQAGVMTTRGPADQVASRAPHHEKPARNDHHGAGHREGNDKPHPSGRGGIRAHRSTIASRYAPRKPYGQVRPSRLAFRTVTAEPARGAALARAGPAIR